MSPCHPLLPFLFFLSSKATRNDEHRAVQRPDGSVLAFRSAVRVIISVTDLEVGRKLGQGEPKIFVLQFSVLRISRMSSPAFLRRRLRT